MGERAKSIEGDASGPLWIVRTLRERGMRIPRFVWQAGESDPPTGLLLVDWTVSEKHRRQMHVARLYSGAHDLLPCMRDVHIVRLTAGDLTITGFEELEDREYAQTWHCRLAGLCRGPRGKPDDPVGRTSD